MKLDASPDLKSGTRHVDKRFEKDKTWTGLKMMLSEND